MSGLAHHVYTNKRPKAASGTVSRLLSVRYLLLISSSVMLTKSSLFLDKTIQLCKSSSRGGLHSGRSTPASEPWFDVTRPSEAVIPSMGQVQDFSEWETDEFLQEGAFLKKPCECIQRLTHSFSFFPLLLGSPPCFGHHASFLRLGYILYIFILRSFSKRKLAIPRRQELCRHRTVCC